VPSSDGVMVAVHHLTDDDGTTHTRLPVVFCHATGFHGRVWQPVADALAARFDCWAIDFRGHGDTRIPADGPIEWTRFAVDLLAAVRHIAATRSAAGSSTASTDGYPAHDSAVPPMYAVGHSMGGAAIALAELANPGTFSRAYLFEPILYPTTTANTKQNALSEGARRRTEVFDSLEHARRRYGSRPPLGRLDPRSLDEYVDHGFDEVEGGVRLKCRRQLEARIFEHSQNGAFERLPEIKTHVVVAAGGDPGAASFAPAAVAEFATAELHIDENLSHFGPMEQPDLIASRIERHLLGETPDR